MVYRLVAKGTIEEKVMALKARKSELFGSIFDRRRPGPERALTADEIRELVGRLSRAPRTGVRFLT